MASPCMAGKNAHAVSMLRKLFSKSTRPLRSNSILAEMRHSSPDSSLSFQRGTVVMRTSSKACAFGFRSRHGLSVIAHLLSEWRRRYVQHHPVRPHLRVAAGRAAPSRADVRDKDAGL